MALSFLNRLIREIYERGWRTKRAFPVPIVSVGNVRYGGSGKTPHVIYISSRMLERGVKVAVLSRGYRREGKGLTVLSPGEIPSNHEEVGDEPYLIKKVVPGIVLGVYGERAKVAGEILKKHDVDLFILDDGFQQFSLKKDMDVVLIPEKDLTRLSDPLFRVTLREDISSLRYADFVLITKCESAYDWASASSVLERVGYHGAWGATRYRVEYIVDNRGEQREIVKGSEYYLFAGVGDMDSFVNLVEREGINVVGVSSFPDHASYSPDDIRKVREMSRGCPLLATEKDLVKLPYDVYGEIFGISLAIEFLRGEDEFHGMIENLVAGMDE